MIDQQTKKLNTRQPNSPSFFDDDNLQAKFEFVMISRIQIPKPLQKPPIDLQVFRMKNLANGHEKQGYFSLYDGYIASCSKMNGSFKIISYLCIDMCILSPKFLITFSSSSSSSTSASSSSPTTEYSFTITKNRITYEFITANESIIDEWLNSMRLMCIHYNFHEEYKAIKMIGKGSFARVYLAEDNQTKLQYAVKACSKEYILHNTKNFAKASVLNEIMILRHLDHENIMSIHKVFETENSLYMVVELIQGKTLEEIIVKESKNNNELRYKQMFKKLLEVLVYLSKKRIMHRDIKPDNILVDEHDNIKVVDFGLATYIDTKELIFDKCGTPGYIAPEIFKYNPQQHNTHYDEKCDVFSAGCILYYMVFGTRFFPGKKSSEILAVNRAYKDNNGPYQALFAQYTNQNSKVSQEALTLLLKMLESDPSKRITASMALEHPYLTTKKNIISSKKSLSENDLQNIHAITIKSPKNNIKLMNNNYTNNISGELANTHHALRDSLDNFKTTFESQNQCNVNEKLKNIGLTKNKASIYLNNDPPLLNGAVATLDSDCTPDSKSHSHYSITPMNRQLSGSKISLLGHGNSNQSSTHNSPRNEMNLESCHLNNHIKKKVNDHIAIKAVLLKNIQKNFDLIKNDNGDSMNNNSNNSSSNNTHQYVNLGFSDFLEPLNQFAVVEEESELAASPTDTDLNKKKSHQIEQKFIPIKK